jgi:hypothetical protein
MLISHRLILWLLTCHLLLRQENAMELAITAMTVVAGMAFSLAIALLVEELIFGKVFRLIAVRQMAQVKSGPER